MVSIGIARFFVGQIPKIELKIMPYFTSRKKWTGWELNPRPQVYETVVGNADLKLYN